MNEEIPPKRSAKSDSVSEALLHGSEMLADAAMHGDALAAIPVVGTAVHLLKAVDTIRERVLIAKMRRFVEGMEGLTRQEIDAMKQRLKDSEELEKIGSNLLLTLDKITEVEKGLLLGKLFRAFVHGRCDQEALRRLVRAVDIAFFDDLISFGRHLGVEMPRRSQLLVRLVETGLAEMHMTSGPSEAGSDPIGVRTTQLGRLMQAILAASPKTRLGVGGR